MTTGLVYAPGKGHSLEGHPENFMRMVAIFERLMEEGVFGRMETIPPHYASIEQLKRVHPDEHIEFVSWAAKQGHGMIHADTYVTSSTFDAACWSAGCGCTAVDAILTGKVKNALALVRPPGHHAGVRSVEGFCLFNNIAIAVRQAQAVYDLKRVAVIDFDVHHGNGTQEIFYEDASVLFYSIHMLAPHFYPGTGRLYEMGVNDGDGMTVNIPLPLGVGDKGYRAIFDSVVEPLLTQFQPQMLFISAGFDAHWRDPLADQLLSLTGYAQLIRQIIGWADRLCDGRLLFILEGGYDLDVLSYSVLNLVYALLGEDKIVDPLGKSAESEIDISDLIVKIQQYHLLV